MKKGLLILVVLTLAITATHCGYRLSGYGKQIPDHIRSISIPDFENKTTRIQAEDFVTFAVREEFILRSSLRLVGDPDMADAVLEGTIVSFDVTPASVDARGSADLYKLKIVISVRFIDMVNDKLIFEGKNISFSDSYEMYDTEVEEMDFFSQESRHLEKVAERFAESVVISILENF